MNSIHPKKLLTILIVLLLIANVATIGLFWFKKENQSALKGGGPAKFIIKELNLDKNQQKQFLALAKEHFEGVAPVRDSVKQAKDDFFSLLNDPNTTADKKLAAAKTISTYTEKIDLITLAHFAKVRAMCNVAQQQKFDLIIKQITQMMGMPHPPGGDQHHGPPPMDGPPEGEMPPPPPEN